jgi:probable O-glycosylation ligase (exosortase A-associated)
MGLLFTYAMTYGGSVVAVFNPYYGLLIYICFGIIRPPDLWYWSVPVGNYSRILAVALLIGWAFRGFGDWRLGRAWPLAICLIGFIAWSALSASQALIPTEAWPWVEAQAKNVLPVVVGMTLIDSVRKLKQLAWVVLLSHGYLAYDFNMSYLSGYNRLQDVGFGVLDNNCMGIALVTCSGLAGFMALGKAPLWQRGITTLALGLMVHAILFSNSRGAMLGLIVLAGVSLILMPKRPAYIALLIAGVLTTLAFAGPQVIERFQSTFSGENERDASATSRVVMWEICLREAAARPLVGLGPHHFPVYARSFGLTEGKEAHSTWVQLLAELGVPGVGFLLGFYVVCIVRTAPLVWGRVPDPWFQDAARMVTAAIVGYVFTAQFVTLPGLEAPYYIALLGAGLLKLSSSPDPDAGTAAVLSPGELEASL